MTHAIWLGVVVIGGLGSVARFQLDRMVAARAGRAFPFGTLAVNISVAILLGVITGLALPGELTLIVGTGCVGAYTTFSTWMLEPQRLAEERVVPAAAANVVVSVVLGLAAAVFGQIGEHL